MTSFTQTIADDYALMADNVIRHHREIKANLYCSFVSLEDGDSDEFPHVTVEEFYRAVLIPDARAWHMESQRLRGGKDNGSP